jgi:hypothetical protein
MNTTQATPEAAALDSLAAGLIRNAFVSHPALRTTLESLAAGATIARWPDDLTAMMSDKATYRAAVDAAYWSEWMLTARWDEDREHARLAYTLNSYRTGTRSADDLATAIRVFHNTVVQLTHARALREAEAL